LILLSFVAYSFIRLQRSDDPRGNLDEDLSTPAGFNIKGTSAANEFVLDPTVSETPSPTNTSTAPQTGEPGVKTLPTRFPRGAIQLKGPPDDSIFPLHAPITIYWDWPYGKEESYHFFVYLIDDSNEYLVGSAAEPSMGNHGYQLNFIPADTINFPGTFHIEIRLEEKETLFVSASSDPRKLTLTQDFS
jgi:hypothetical protein